MKYRVGPVTNSSSANFIVGVKAGYNRDIGLETVPLNNEHAIISHYCKNMTYKRGCDNLTPEESEELREEMVFFLGKLIELRDQGCDRAHFSIREQSDMYQLEEFSNLLDPNLIFTW